MNRFVSYNLSVKIYEFFWRIGEILKRKGAFIYGKTEFWELTWCDSDCLEYTINGEQHFTLTPDKCLLIPPGLDIRVNATQRSFKQFVIKFMVDVLHLPEKPTVYLIDFTKDMEFIKDKLYYYNPPEALRERADFTITLCCMSLVYDALFQVPMEALWLTATNEALHRVIDYIHGNPYDNHSLEDLAKIAGLSKYGFLREFHNYTGFTPHEYQNYIRLSTAFSLIIEERKSVQEVSDILKYNDPFQFSKAFKRVFHVSPKDLKE